MISVLIGSTFLQLLAAFLSIRFVYFRRMGRPWLLVSLALIILGGLRFYPLIIDSSDPNRVLLDPTMETISLLVSLLLASGFALTERWFILKERVESRFRLITEVDRSLVGVLDEGRVLSIVCEVLSHRKGYRLAWIAAGEPDGSVRIVNTTGEGETLLANAGIRWDDVPDGQGPTSSALRTGEACVVNCVKRNPRLAAWERHLAGTGIRSMASARIVSDGLQPMALTVYADTRSAFDRLEMEAISALVHRIGAAIQSARRHELFVRAKDAYDDLLRTQLDGVILVRGGRIVRANPAAAEMLGYLRGDELIGLDPAEMLRDPQGKPEVAKSLRCGDERGGRSVWEAEILRKDGSSFDGEVTTTWLPRDYKGATWVPTYEGPLGMSILRDITQKNQVLENIRRQRDFSEKILDIAGVLVAQMDPFGKIILVNRCFEEVTGYAWGEIAGKEMAAMLFAETSRDYYMRKFAGILKGRIPSNLDIPLLPRIGKERIVVWNHAILWDSAGQVTSVIAVGTDVTESRRLERKIMGMRDEEEVDAPK